MTVCHPVLSKLLGTTLTAIALGSSHLATAQTFDVPDNAEELLPATGNSQDLDGLQERGINDWFPQNGISEGESETILKIDEESYRPTVNDPQIIRNQENDWKNNASGDPKQTGSGIPLGEF